MPDPETFSDVRVGVEKVASQSSGLAKQLLLESLLAVSENAANKFPKEEARRSLKKLAH